MFTNIVVALKPDLDNEILLNLTEKVASGSSKVHLVSFVTAGTEEDPSGQLKTTVHSLRSHAERLSSTGAEVTYDAKVIAAAAASEVLRVAEERDADLIVAGLTKRSRVGKALMGSDAQRLLLGAECAVLAERLPA